MLSLNRICNMYNDDSFCPRMINQIKTIVNLDITPSTMLRLSQSQRACRCPKPHLFIRLTEVAVSGLCCCSHFYIAPHHGFLRERDQSGTPVRGRWVEHATHNAGRKNPYRNLNGQGQSNNDNNDNARFIYLFPFLFCTNAVERAFGQLGSILSPVTQAKRISSVTCVRKPGQRMKRHENTQHTARSTQFTVHSS